LIGRDTTRPRMKVGASDLEIFNGKVSV